MKIDITNCILVLLGIVLILCFIIMLMDKKQENFDPVVDAIQLQLKNENPTQLKQTIQALQQRLIDYGYAPDLKQYVKKTELGQDSGKCLVNNAEDRDKYISKSDTPLPGPRIDLSQYVKKSSIPPEKICAPAPSIDLSAYVKKSTLPPNEKCPPCISPKVKVSAGLCRECPPAPSCPAPEPCPQYNCPPPAPCPQKECVKCDEVRYIKVPAVITKTVTVDQNGNVLSQKIDSGNPTTTQAQANTTTQAQAQAQETTTTQAIPTTTFPTMSYTPNITLAQTLAHTKDNNSNSSFCPSSSLNNNFSKYSSIKGREL